LEQLVLLAVARLGDNAYGMTVRREIAARTGRELSLGAVYTTLDRLERKGYVRSATGEPTTEREGRGRRLFRIETAGEAVLAEALATLDQMRADLPMALRPANAGERR
jgi:PadR family transcriptional regulator, regulatory protein PadR